MALERLTQITEVGIQSGITLRNVNVEGAYVSGVVTATSLNITGGGANFVGVVTATSFNGNVTGNITPTGLVVSGVSTFQSSSFWGDGDIAYFGDGQDLLIFHNSTDSIIRDNGTGDLYIEGGNRIRLTNPTAIETYAVFNQDGASELYYDNVKRLETSGIGVSVTSALTVGTGASVYSPTTNVLALGTNNSERVRIDSSGRVGIGTDIPGSYDSGGRTLVISENSTLAGMTLRSSNQGAIYFADGLTGNEAYRGRIEYSHSSDSLNFGTAGTGSKLTLTSAGAVQVANGNLVFSTAGTGIDFSATANSSGTMTSELLNDYEEGTWTPNIDNAYITSPGTTYNSRAGKYVKVGKMVLARFTMNIAGVTNSGVGPFFFGGLPFSEDTSDISHRGLQASLYISGPNTPAGAVNVNLGYATLDNGNYYLTLSTPIDDAASNNSRVIQASDISNGDVISGTIMYIST